MAVREKALTMEPLNSRQTQNYDISIACICKSPSSLPVLIELNSCSLVPLTLSVCLFVCLFVVERLMLYENLSAHVVDEEQW